MKVVQVHNYYRSRAGECVVFEAIVDLLKRHNVEVHTLTKKSQGIDNSFWTKLSAFGSGIYSLSAARDMSKLLQRLNPDVVHIHNLYPLISPSVAVTCYNHRIPVVMTCHNYRLVCPIGTFFCKDRTCESCADGKEYWCMIKNCRNNYVESTVYALRGMTARRFGLISKNVTLFIAVSEFQRRKLTEGGIDRKKIIVLPHMVNTPDFTADPVLGRYVAFVGRISEEKGIDTLLSAAKNLPEASFSFAGGFTQALGMKSDASNNVEFVGWLDRAQLSNFYRMARFVVVPSKCYETFGLVILEAMSHGLPVIASRIGGLPEVIDDGVTGVFFEPGNSYDLASKIKLLWKNPQVCRKMGQAAREKVVAEYSEEKYYDRLLSVYETAIKLNRE